MSLKAEGRRPEAQRRPAECNKDPQTSGGSTLGWGPSFPGAVGSWAGALARAFPRRLASMRPRHTAPEVARAPDNWTAKETELLESLGFFTRAKNCSNVTRCLPTCLPTCCLPTCLPTGLQHDQAHVNGRQVILATVAMFHQESIPMSPRVRCPGLRTSRGAGPMARPSPWRAPADGPSSNPSRRE